LVNAQDEIQFPDFITVIREVTDDDSYKNHALAASVPSEES
jgi:CYTH domain-containing protein